MIIILKFASYVRRVTPQVHYISSYKGTLLKHSDIETILRFEQFKGVVLVDEGI
jgi:hypothetical protein